ncbi:MULTISPECIES: molecular chaperone [unclassified Serratia (in: enterobacteria)]|uniref:fimbrial biogenesis chaperone n=1 Tax=unclassified Serratia (in: enterobacteria) TaxID=2647522 RepID=UPI00046ABE10|nr:MULTISPECIES: molecular chaperone [unclassified Serratia (in: enterobacteria)]
MCTFLFSPSGALAVVTGGLLLASGVTLAAPSPGSPGGVSLSQTRVVFLSTDKAQTLAIKNTDSRVYLIQSRVQMTPDETTAAPFVVTPPLFTLQPDNRQLLRIVAQGDEHPKDRESVFYLSVLAIPAREGKDIAPVQVSMGMRFVIKLFYRPAGLQESMETTACRLRFMPVPGGLRVENPTPYFQTLGHLTFNGTPVNMDVSASMLAPFGSVRYRVTGTSGQADWQTVTDYGGLSARCRQTVPSTQETS